MWTCDEAYLVDGVLKKNGRRIPFCASIGFRGDVCTFAAPILRKVFLGWDKDVCRATIRREGWRVLG